MLGDLTGRTAIVTGGGKGVGRAIAIALAEGGADVALADIDVNSAGDVASELEAGGRKAMALDMDVTSVESVRAAVRKAIDEWGRIDILVNNAGIVGAPGWIEAAEDRYEDWDAVVSVNLRGVVNCCKAVIPHMIESSVRQDHHPGFNRGEARKWRWWRRSRILKAFREDVDPLRGHQGRGNAIHADLGFSLGRAQYQREWSCPGTHADSDGIGHHPATPARRS